MSIALVIIVLLVIGCVLVNGWNDAPNAIATVVSTRSMSTRSAIIMAAVFNFLGVFVMTTLNAKVAETVSSVADFGTGDEALGALAAALFAVVVFSTVASKKGIPISISHALIAGITGGAIAVGGIESVNVAAWIKVGIGLIISSVLGLALGYACSKVVKFSFKGMKRKTANVFFKWAQNAAGAFVAFLHGAQDGQKFIGILMLGVFLSKGQVVPDNFDVKIWMMVMCSVIMGIGTSVGGYAIIKAVGMDMVKLEKHEGFSASLAASICLLLASLTGIPVSTTHTKTTAVMGVGSAKRLSNVNWNVAGGMVNAWIVTFPSCIAIGYVMAFVFVKIF